MCFSCKVHAGRSASGLTTSLVISVVILAWLEIYIFCLIVLGYILNQSQLKQQTSLVNDYFLLFTETAQ